MTFKPFNPIVTNHVMMRYIERVLGFSRDLFAEHMGATNPTDRDIVRYMELTLGVDLEKARQEILNKEVQAMLKMGIERHQFGDHIYIAKNGKLITILYKHEEEDE